MNQKLNLCKKKFGFRFMKPGDEVENIMGEDASNFQEFFADEKVEILSMFESYRYAKATRTKILN